ncbi:MAG: hypothetical protein HY658_06340 [Actinobacteria bacterium]|nr:hypothetical protein [Actinomycetota bacterium]
MSRSGVGLLAVALLAAACTGGDPGDGPTPTEEGPAVEIDAGQAERVLRAAALDDPATLQEVDRIRETPEAVAAAEAILASGGAEGGVLWAAVYVYAAHGELGEPLAPLIGHADPSIRVLAASGLVARGDARGFASLIEALETDENLAGGEPPIAIWRVAAIALVTGTGRADLGPPLDADARIRELSRARWTAWLEENEGTLRFDPATGEWYER